MTVTPGISWGYWKARNIPALARSSAGQALTSSPRRVIVPAVTAYSGEPISAEASVLLPEPFGPITAWISPAPTVKSRPRMMSGSGPSGPGSAGRTLNPSTRKRSSALIELILRACCYFPDRRDDDTGPVEVVDDDGPQLGGDLLGQRVEDERAEPRLDAGPHLEAVRVAMGREQLDVEVPVGAGGPVARGRRFLHDHHVRHRESPQPVVAADDIGEGAHEIEGGVAVEVAEPPDAVASGPDLDLERPTRGERDGRHEVLVGVDHPLAVEILGHQLATEARRVGTAMPFVAGELRRRHGR